MRSPRLDQRAGVMTSTQGHAPQRTRRSGRSCPPAAWALEAEASHCHAGSWGQSPLGEDVCRAHTQPRELGLGEWVS